MAAFAVDTLVRSVGKMMAKLHGFPNYPYVVIPAPYLEGVMIPEKMFQEKTRDAIARAEELLLTGKMQ
ncbi:MAG: hypothetical protein IIC80_06935 [Chloroflexi bacterium]|nr:hypothetical protein [Chloroflexota bacterium]MCH8284877.1 hypothetical protein [Chloroflexota bacterium]